MNRKKGILLYFDNFHLVADLPDEQLGLLFRALMECGEREAAGEDGLAGFELRCPRMSERTRMAFSFMADNLRRDAAAYHQKCANYRAAAQRREDSRREDRQRRDEMARYAQQFLKNRERPGEAAP